MNKKIKGKISTLFMLAILITQTLTPVVTVFADNTTGTTQPSSEIQSINEETSQITVGTEGTAVPSSTPPLAPPSTTVSSEEIATTDTSSSISTSENQEVVVEEETNEEDEEPAQSSTGELP